MSRVVDKRRQQCTDPCTACFSQRRISKPHSCGLNGAPWNSGGMPVDLKGEGGWQQSALTVALLMAISAWCPTAQGFLLPASCCQFTAPRTPPTDAEDVVGTSSFCSPWSESDHCLTCSPAPWVLSTWGRPVYRNGAGTRAEDATTVMSAASKRRPPTLLQGWPSLSSFDSPQAARSRWAFGEDKVCSLPRPTVAQESRGLRSCWRLEAKKLDRDSSRHGGGEKHGAAAQAGGRDGGNQDMGKGADSDASPAQNSPLRWMRRTQGAGWGRRGHRADAIAAGKWGFQRGGASKRRDRYISVGGSGQRDCEVSMVGVKEAEEPEEPEEGENGWGLSGSVDAGSKGWPNEEVRHAWFSSFGGGGGNSGGGDGGKQTWGSKTPWTDRNALQELFRTKGGDLHIRTVAKIQTMLGQEDQAEETLLRLIRDPYHLGDASWTPESVAETAEWRRLDAHQKRIKDKHLKDVIQDTERSLALSAEYEGTILDYSRMNVSQLTMKLLFDLAKRQGLKEKIQAMFHGEKINNTENRAVLHVALRTDKGDDPIMVDGVNVVEQVHDTLDKVKDFSDQVRSGRLRGATGKLLTNIVAVGIGGSYLGPEFLHEAFKTQEYPGREQAELYRLRFLSNVDPVDVRRTLYDLDPEETLVVVISKTFTTAETMLNARTARQWLWDTMGKGTDPSVTEKHMAACASESSAERVMAFGIPRDRLFPLWDWVGGRYSVCSSVGALPLSLKYGSRQFENFLAGARSMDKHFLHAPLDKNLPVLMGLLGVWNISFMGYKTRTILPYAEALLKFPAHIQQLAMESNGKRVTRNGKKVSYDIGQVDFGEPGTNGQHSFFQLLHMGQICPAEFIGFIESQHPLHVEGEPLCSHDELMANFFAQPDALAVGKFKDDLVREGCRPDLVPHRTFDGNRPSLSLLVPKVNAYHLGQILALYEHRTAVEGFMWDINSFDQWGVELGKSLATNVREKMEKFRTEGQEAPTGLNPSTQRLMSRYLQQSETLVKKVGNINHRSRNSPDKTLNRGSSTNAA